MSEKSKSKDLIGDLTRRQVLGGAAIGLLAVLADFKAVHAAGKKLKVGLIMPNYDQLRWRNADQAFFEKEAAKLGMNVLAQASNANESLQASQVENMLTQGIDVLVLTPVNPNAANGLVRKAKKAGVPIINYNFLINNAEVVCFLGRDATEMGGEDRKSRRRGPPEGQLHHCRRRGEYERRARDAARLPECAQALSRPRRHQARVRSVQQELVDRHRPRSGRKCADQERERRRGSAVRQ
jgi:D-xylose transport system substrate-binding protein